MLEEVCASSQGPAAHFVQSHLDDLKKTLLDSLRSTSSPAKRVRALGCLVYKGGRASTPIPRAQGDTGGSNVVVPTAPSEVPHTHCEEAVSGARGVHRCPCPRGEGGRAGCVFVIS